MALRQIYQVVEVGTPFNYEIKTFYSPINFALTPGVGGGMLVRYRYTNQSEFINWPLGEVNTYTEDEITSPIYELEITATISDGLIEIVHA
ncbi:MAG: hypothetical protein KC589_05650 [Nanoarchaeota archaeon]|nr:hypothetical protein [Nanoarchaeota archaeon]